MRGWGGFRRGGGGLSRGRERQLALATRERRQSPALGALVAVQGISIRSNSSSSGMEAADGAKRLVQAAAIHTPVQSHNSAVFSRRSCNGGGDVEGRWRPEINVSNHLELEGAPSH